MPELPDLEVFGKSLQEKLKGRRLVRITVAVSKRLKQSLRKIKNALEGSKLKKVSRKGKELYFIFDNDSILAIHLMLHGEFQFVEEKKKPAHLVAQLEFEDRLILAVTDWQKMVTPTLNPDEPIAPDALSRTVTPGFISKILKSSGASVKNVLLNQKIIRGIGNAYADEILWDARISPFSTASSIPAKKQKQLAVSIKKVLKSAIKQIQKKDPQRITGELRDFLATIIRKKKKVLLELAF